MQLVIVPYIYIYIFNQKGVDIEDWSESGWTEMQVHKREQRNRTIKCGPVQRTPTPGFWSPRVTQRGIAEAIC